MKKKKALVLASVYFNSKIKVGSQHYAEALEKDGYEVLYISFPVSIFHYLFYFRSENLKRILRRSNSFHNSRICTFIPFSIIPLLNVFPFNTEYILRKWIWCSDLFINRSVRHFIKDVEIIWVESAYFIDFAEYCFNQNPNLRIYTRLADNVLAFDNFPKKYEKLLSRSFLISDKIVVSARTLISIIDPVFHSKVNHLPNGINTNILKQYSVELPSEYLNDKNKVKIVYIGAIESWFDWDIIEYLLYSLNGISVYIIGPLKNKPSFSHKALYLLGTRSHSEIGRYLKNAQVGIIPFKRNELINYVDPIKFYEYSFFNLPTVCTFWDEVSTFKESIFLARDKKEFVDQVKFLVSPSFDKNSIIIDVEERDWYLNLKQIL